MSFIILFNGLSHVKDQRSTPCYAANYRTNIGTTNSVCPNFNNFLKIFKSRN